MLSQMLHRGEGALPQTLQFRCAPKSCWDTETSSTLYAAKSLTDFTFKLAVSVEVS